MVTLDKRKILLLSGSLFSLAGFFALLYFFYFLKPSGTGWDIVIKGCKHLKDQELKETVLYLIQTEKKGVSAEQIKDTLILNPRIKDAFVKIRPGKKILIELTEKETVYAAISNTSGISVFKEYDINDNLMSESDLSENILYIDSKVPIFYLTVPKENKMYAQELKRDIIKLWQKTKDKYGFIWQRISEIEISSVNKNHSIFNIYSADLPARIILEMEPNEKMLQRLWSVFYMLEKQKANKWYDIEIYQHYAVTRTRDFMAFAGG
ncbi:MAG: FtsQ-type POTRA domain-containing protein [Spirochaetia bacterium]|nr:FtsQ-type POTRA domain-containing protein [Spirochaetia bacterium]